MNKINALKLWFINRLKEKTTWVGLIALASIFGYGGYDSASADQLATALAIVVSSILIGVENHKQN